MKRSANVLYALIALIIINLLIAGCKKKDNPAKYTVGTFPDSVYNLTGLNSGYDDYNSTILSVGNKMPVIFSSNRLSSGGQFDLVQGSITYSFDFKSGAFSISSSITTDPLLTALISKAVTSGNDFGPYSLNSTTDGYNYLFLASQTATAQLDIFYLKYLPQFGTSLPVISAPLSATLLNTNYDDAYVSFDLSEDSVYFMSNRGGNYDIYVQTKSSPVTLDAWMSKNYSAASAVDSVNSSYDEKCPFVLKNYMVFASNRPGGLGGYDLYCSLFKNGKWSAPVNLGPTVNSSSDEFRPVLGYNAGFSNMFLIFSSKRAGGAGGFDLYFTGFSYPE